MGFLNKLLGAFVRLQATIDATLDEWKPHL